MATEAFAMALHQPWATIVLSGAATTAQLDSNLRALSTTVDPDRLAHLAEPPEQYWQERANLPWS
jgi:aryl-alcohol dehydrogenase-like predicted oxidoreductase